MKFTIAEIRKALLSQVHFLPGNKIRPECNTFKCPIYASMLVLNNNSDLENKVICPKILCKRVQKGNFQCQLTNKRYSIMNGAHIDFEFYSYASLLNKEVKSAEPIKTQSTEIPQHVLEEEPKNLVVEDMVDLEKSIPPVIEEKVEPKVEEKLNSVDEYISRLCVDMNALLDIKTFKEFIHKGSGFLMFSNPFVHDLTKASIKINFSELLDYGAFFARVKEYFSDYVVLRKATSCKGCGYLSNKPYAPGCATCTRNEGIATLMDVPKQDNYNTGGGLIV